MRRILFLSALILMLGFQANAQKRKTKVPAKPVTVEKKEAVSPLYQQMLPATAKVLFIDSIVVDKDSFLYYIPLNKESGDISEYKGDAVYTNEYGNRRYIAMGDSASRILYTSDKLAGKWSEPQPLEGISDEYDQPDHPFVASDGVTLYFAAKGKRSIGGYDVFMTVFNSDSSKYFKPENLGLPFNSRFNEYMIAFDDLDSLGWLVSDRWQPSDKVCIYTFATSASRHSYEADNLPEAKLKRLADLRSIRDTWQYGNIDAALKRLTAMLQRSNSVDAEDRMTFVVDDTHTYHALSDFRSASARKLWTQLNEMTQMLQKEDSQLSALRDAFHLKRPASMVPKITQLEEKVQTLRTDIKKTEKKIRNLEIQSLK
ncbi:MAG: hypothetical protein PUG09_09635 [Prevotella sp.]|nr:hypothetical protein [Prevotella sp.]